MSQQPFLTDIQTIRTRARRQIEDGAVTGGYKGDPAEAVRILNEALATEVVCTLRYKNHYYMASGLNSESVKAEFLEHANEEQQHADKIAERIVQLGGEPNFSPDGIATRSHSEYRSGETLVDLIKEDLVAERIAIDTYREIVDYFGENDPTSRRVMEEVLAGEEEHAEDMASLLQKVNRSANGHARPSAS